LPHFLGQYKGVKKGNVMGEAEDEPKKTAIDFHLLAQKVWNLVADASASNMLCPTETLDLQL